MRPFNSNCKGSIGVEFAIVFPIFIFLIFSVIEFGFLMFMSSVVNNAVTEAGRVGITGSNYAFRQVLEEGEEPLTREEYIEELLQEKIGAISNYGLLEITTQTYSDLSTLSIGSSANTLGFGESGEIVVYTVSFTVDVLSPILTPFLGEDGKYVIVAQTVLQNEGFNEAD